MLNRPKNRYEIFVERIPYEDVNWDGAINICFSQAHVGWILLWVTTTAYLQSLTIYCSDVFPPFADMVKWLEAISEGQLPAAFNIDEEGDVKTLRAIPAKNGYLDFQIVDEELEDEPNILLRARVLPRQLISEFVFKLELLLEKDYQAEDYPYAPNLNELDLSKLRLFLNK